MLLEKLKSLGITDALEALGYDCEKILEDFPRRRRSCMLLIPGERFRAQWKESVRLM